MDILEQLLTDTEAAKFLGISVTILRRDRCQSSLRPKLNIPYIKIGGSIRYSPSQLRTWIKSHTRNQPLADLPALPAAKPEVVDITLPVDTGKRGRGRPRLLPQLTK